jgi:hypothetical protein
MEGLRMSFTVDNHDRMGEEYHTLQGTIQIPNDDPCDNLGERDTFPIKKSGTPATNYLGTGREIIETSGRRYRMTTSTGEE